MIPEFHPSPRAKENIYCPKHGVLMCEVCLVEELDKVALLQEKHVSNRDSYRTPEEDILEKREKTTSDHIGGGTSVALKIP